MLADQVERYLDTHAVDPPEAGALPAPRDALSLVVTVPVYRERSTLPSVVESLERASEQSDRFEVLVVVNNAADAPPEARRENTETLEYLRTAEVSYPLHTIDRASTGRAFAPSDAGVGRARRLAMDVALARLHRAGNEPALITCLDGDSPAAEGYADDLLREFDRAPPSVLAGSCRYRHPLPEDPEHVAAIASYESWMRYFEAGLRRAGSPYAFQSIGSCLALRAGGYALADGCPTREALSDFYLLQTVVKNGGPGAVRQLTRPLVRPSARPSDRVPRGTGPSVAAAMHGEGRKYRFVEPVAVFDELGRWFDAVGEAFDRPEALDEAAGDALGEFLDRWEVDETISKLRENAPDPRRFRYNVHQWFDSLKIVKFANWYRRERSTQWIFDAVPQLLADLGVGDAAATIPRPAPGSASADDWRGLLAVLREHELEIAMTPDAEVVRRD